MDILSGLAADTAFSSRYALGPLLGEGGMGSVFSGIQRPLNRPVAIKVLHVGVAFGDKDVVRFQREARLLASLSHPNIVILFDYGVAGEFPYLVTELLDGQSLQRLISDRGSLTVPEVLPIARGILSGLSAMHRAGIIHRDLKPHNIQILPTQPPSAKILDFGIATLLAPTAPALTAAGRVMGTPDFMAPEQLRGEPATEASDLYAFTLVLAEMILGESPFALTAGQPLERLRAEPAFPGTLSPGVRALLMRGLAGSPEDRFPSAAGYLAALNRLESELTSTGSFFAPVLPSAPTVQVSLPVPVAPPPRPFPWLALMTGLVAGLVVPLWMPKASVSRAVFTTPSIAPLPTLPVPPLPDDSLFGRWRQVLARKKALLAGGPAAATAMNTLRAETGLDLGGSPKTWLYWCELGEWAAAPGTRPRPGSPALTMSEIDHGIFNGYVGPIPLNATERIMAAVIRQLAVTPGAGLVWLALGWVLERDGQPALAQVADHAGLALIRTLPDRIGSGLLWLGLVRASLQHRPEWLNDIARIAPDEPDAGLRGLVELGIAGLNNNHVENFVLSMVRVYPGSQNMDVVLGRYWRATGRHREAAALWLKAERRAPRENLEAELRSLAWYLLDRGNVEEIVPFRNVLPADPELESIRELLLAADKCEKDPAPATRTDDPALIRIRTFCLLEQGRLPEATDLVGRVRTRILAGTGGPAPGRLANPFVDLSLDLLGAGVTNEDVLMDIQYLLGPRQPWTTWEKVADTLSSVAGAPYFSFLAQEEIRFLHEKSQQLLVHGTWASRLSRHEEALDDLGLATRHPRDPDVPWSVPCEILMRALFAGTGRERVRASPWPPEGTRERKVVDALADKDLTTVERLSRELYEESRTPWWGLASLRAALARGESALVAQTARELRSLARRRAQGYWVLRELDDLLNKKGASPR